MNPQFWIDRWKSGETGWHRAEPHPLLVKHFSALPPGKVMVPLCGKSLDLQWLRAQGHEGVGIELSSLACEGFFRDHSLPVQTEEREGFRVHRSQGITLWQGDFFMLPEEAWEGCTALYDRAALIALPPELRPPYAESIRTRWKAPPGARLLLITFDFPPERKEGPPFRVTPEEVRALYGASFQIDHHPSPETGEHAFLLTRSASA